MTQPLVADLRLYTRLNIHSRASQEKIKETYHILSRQLHPDKNGGRCSKEYYEITEAYNILSNPVTRRIYDVGGMRAIRRHFEDDHLEPSDPQRSTVRTESNTSSNAFEGPTEHNFLLPRIKCPWSWVDIIRRHYKYPAVVTIVLVLVCAGIWAWGRDESSIGFSIPDHPTGQNFTFLNTQPYPAQKEMW